MSTASKSPSASPGTGPSRNPPQPANRFTLADSHSAEEPHSAEEEEEEDQTSQTNAVEHGTLSSHTDWTDGFEPDSESDETASDSSEPDLEEHASGHETLSEDPGCTCRKRKRPRVTGRTIDADRKADVPTYRVKRSKKTPGQQRGLDWLSAAGKAHFDNTLEVLLAQWGVKAGHRGTCVLLPEDWKALEPVELMAIFQNHELPSGSGRAWYSYSDHATSLGRAAAWFGSWPRKKEGRPDLLCAFCPRIKGYASITGFWAHLVNKHRDVDDQRRLEEICRAGSLWRTYWERYSDGGKYGNPTMAKLRQIEQEGFGWQQVLDWGLR